MFVIERPIKTIIKSEEKHLIFSLLLFLIMVLPVFAQRPSFEIYPLGGHPWPDIENISVNKVSDSLVTIEAEVTDVSSIYSAGVIIKDSAGNQKETQLLYDDGNLPDDWSGDSIYSGVILIDSYPLDTFTVDFFATDVFGNRASLPNAGSFTTGGALPGYSYRRKITIQNDQIESDLANFPLLVSIPSVIAGKMTDTANWNDIRFTGSDGLTPLTYEKESMSASGGKYWVKIPNLFATPVGRQHQIFVYYGNAEDTGDSENVPANVWDSSFKGVWHSKDITTSTINDSTSNANSGTKKATNEPIEANGKIGKAQQYDGANDYVRVLDSASLSITGTGLTLGAWIKPNVGAAEGAIIHKEQHYSVLWRSTGAITYADKITWNYATIGNYGNAPAGQWSHVNVTFNGSNIKFYINGAEVGNKVRSGSLTDNTYNLSIGSYNFSSSFFNGLIDEARVSNIARSAEWIKFEYANVSQTDNELTWGGEE